MLPEFLIRPAVEEAARGISAVYDHLVVSDGSSSSDEDTSNKVEVPRITKCGKNPDEAYIGEGIDAKFTPTFTCNAVNGKCVVKCPQGSLPKLKKASCKKSMGVMAWKPKPVDGAALCVPGLNTYLLLTNYPYDLILGLSEKENTDYTAYCTKLKQPVTEANMARMEKSCKLIANGKKLMCNLKCISSGDSMKSIIKMSKKGANAGTKKILGPVCQLIKTCQ